MVLSTLARQPIPPGAAILANAAGALTVPYWLFDPLVFSSSGQRVS